MRRGGRDGAAGRRHRGNRIAYAVAPGVDRVARLGETQKAIDANLSIIELQPENFSAMRNLAVLYRNDEQLEKAVEWTEKALAITAEDNASQIMQLRQFLVELYGAMEQPEQVALQYELMRQAEPNNASILSNLYALYAEQDNIDKAAEILEALIAVEPGNYQYPLDLAQILFAEGEVSSARQYAEQALALAPEDQKASINQLIQSIDAGS
jgi:tetratricopeptide (TPR) repeat protein